jgi:hypothetical protein
MGNEAAGNENSGLVASQFPNGAIAFPKCRNHQKNNLPLLLGSREHGDETGLAEEGQHHDGTGGEGEEGKDQGKFAKQEGEQYCDTKHEPT